MRVHDILKQLEKTNLINVKVEILKQNKDNELSKKVFYYTYNKMDNFYIKKIPNIKNHLDEITIENDEVWEELDDLRNRKVTDNAARDLVQITLTRLNKDVVEIFTKILKKDLKIKVNTKLINRVWKKLIPETLYMGCRSHNKKDFNKLLNTTDEVYCKVNYNGEFVNIISNNGIRISSKNGKDIYLEYLFENIPDNHVLISELLIKNMDRNTSNGIINSLKQLNEKIKQELLKIKILMILSKNMIKLRKKLKKIFTL